MQGFGNLPRDLFLEIFLRLPVESLTRFKCVCKSWYALINDPKFISMHLNYNSNNHEFVLIKRCLFTCLAKKENMFSLVSRNNFSSVNMVVDLPLYKKEPYLQILGHCDGIICLSNYRDYIVLCNPATKESMVLPKPCLPCFSSNPNLIPQISALGFGYDLKNVQYKVVRIVSYWEEFGDILPQRSRVEVYTMGTDCWREIENAKVPANVQFSPCFETYFNGAFHWHAMDYNNNNEVILSFNMGEEEFQVIPMPDFLSIYDNSVCRSLLVWNGCLALIIYPGKGAEKSFQICVMEKYGLKESWTRKLTIGPLTGVEMPLMFWRNDGEILMEGTDGQAVSYNFITKEIKNLQIYGVPKSFQAVAYTNSLVSSRRGKSNA